MYVTSTGQVQALVRDRRRSLGLSQDTVAAMAGVSRKWVSEFERGKAAADVTLVFRLLGALNLRIQITRPGDQPAPSANTQTMHNVDLDGLLNNLLGGPR